MTTSGGALVGSPCTVWTVATCPNGRWFVSGAKNERILVREVVTNRVPISFEGHEGSVWSIVFAPGNETFASSSLDDTVCVLQRETGEIVGPLQVGTGTDEHIIVWNTASREELLKIQQWAWQGAFTPDDHRLVSGSDRYLSLRCCHRRHQTV
ncbi:WD40 repeat-like protein [Suillus weaverae]|nr:WD40 repeat-like protein [Suillus weaverae]